jgi:hypothetical protein
VLVGVPHPAAAESVPAGPASPEGIEGLEAWYTGESLHANHSDGDPVVAWKDSSGNGHHLQGDLRGVKPLFVTQELNGHPGVQVGKGATFKVFRPYDLDDHTIFVVFRSEFTSRALFSSETDPRRGVLLRDESRFHHYQKGGKEFVYTYNTPLTLGKGFTITVLTRDAGLLGCFIDGRDVSSGTRFSDIVRVGTLFKLEHSQHAQSDGEGLHVAELIVFNRPLAEAERNAVTRYLAEKFAIEVDFTTPAPAAAEPPSEAAPPVPGPEGARLWVRSHDRSNLHVAAWA